jgi:hypothetical protein
MKMGWLSAKAEMKKKKKEKLAKLVASIDIPDRWGE